MFPPSRDLTLDDVKDLQNMKGNAFDALVAVAGRAKVIFDVHVAALETRIKAETSYEEGESSTSTGPRKTKCDLQPSAPPPLPEKFQRKIGEMAEGKELTPPTLAIQKRLFKADVSRGQNRLSIPMSQIEGGFLTEEENSNVCERDATTNKKKYMEVTMIEPSLRVETVKFCRWDMEKDNGGEPSVSYVINGPAWSAIVERNKLQVNMEVQLWSFRVDKQLCFALVCLPPPKKS